MALALPRRSTRAASDRVDKRELILRAAVRTFADRGFFGAQVADVARAAGVAAGTVYLYFRGKDDLLVSIFERTMREAITEGKAALANAPSSLDRLRRIAHLHLERLGRDRATAVVFQVELRQSTKFMEQFSSSLVREYLGIIRDVIAEGQAAGVFRRHIGYAGPDGDIEQGVPAVGLVQHPEHCQLEVLPVGMPPDYVVQAPFPQSRFTFRVPSHVGRICFDDAEDVGIH